MGQAVDDPEVVYLVARATIIVSGANATVVGVKDLAFPVIRKAFARHLKRALTHGHRLLCPKRLS